MNSSEIVVVALIVLALLVCLALVRGYNIYRTQREIRNEQDSVAMMTVFGICVTAAIALAGAGIIAATWPR